MRGVRSEMRSKSSMSSSTPASVATASRWRTALVEPPLPATAAIAFSSETRVMISLGFLTARRTSMTSRPAVMPPPEERHDEPARRLGDLGLARLHGRHDVRGDRADPEDLEGHGHRVRRELAAARARRAVRDLLELGELGLGHLARGHGADGLEDVEDRHVAVVEAPGRNRAAVE